MLKMGQYLLRCSDCHTSIDWSLSPPLSSNSQLMATGRFTRRITIHRASTSDELKVHLISLDYGRKSAEVVEVHEPTIVAWP